MSMNTGHTPAVERSARNAPTIFRDTRWYVTSADCESAIVACKTDCEKGYGCVVLPQRYTRQDWQWREKVAMPVSWKARVYKSVRIVASRDQRSKKHKL